MRKGSYTSCSVPASSPTATASVPSPTGPPPNFSTTGAQDARVHVVEAELVHVEPPSAACAMSPVDGAVGLDLGVVAHAPEQAVGHARRAAAAARDLERALRRHRTPRIVADRATMRSRSAGS